MIRSIVRAVLYTVWVAAFVVGIDYFALWRPFVSELRERERPKSFEIGGFGEADTELIKLTGSIRTDRLSSFARFEPRKSADTERLCAFGDSYTYGDEVNSGQDYPSQLQRLYLDAGRPVEILNFGSSWHGFHQTFILWERFASRYSCDVILLGPGSFWADRDTEFNHTDMASPYYVHSRFILEGDGLRLIQVPGSNYRERFDEYWSFFPHWNYLRYDRNPPAFLRAAIPRDRTIANPFYYRSDLPEDEAKATWRLLLRRMAGAGKPIIMSHLRPEIVKFAKSLDNDHIHAMHAWSEDRFPYMARQGHFSSFGNWVVAKQFMAAIESDRTPMATLLESHEDMLPQGDDLPIDRPLSEYRKMTVEIERFEIGFFGTASTLRQNRGNGSAEGVYATNVSAFVAIVPRGKTLIDAAYVQLNHALTDQSELRLRVGGDGDATVHTLGSIERMHPNLQIGKFEISDLVFENKRQLVLADHAQAPFEREVPLVILVDDEPVLEMSRSQEDGTVAFRPTGGWLRQITTLKTDGVNVEDLPSHGVYMLHLEHPEAGSFRVPLASWRKAETELSGPEEERDVFPVGRPSRPSTR